ncbi:unnamed protein product, partial [Urochloa humidicola]
GPRVSSARKACRRRWIPFTCACARRCDLLCPQFVGCRLPPPSILSQGHAVESIPKSAAWSGAATQREVADQGVGLVMVPDGMDRDAACRLAIQFLEH